MPIRRLLSPAAVFLMAAASAAAAAPAAGDHQRVDAFKAVIDCRGLADNAARLACYDAAAAKMDQAEAHGDIVVVDRKQATQAHREAFGLPMPSLDFINRALKPEEVDRIEGEVRSARADASGNWTIALVDGAQWRQISGELNTAPKPGAKVSIRKGTLGSFLMNIDGQPAIKVHRDQ